MRLENYIMEQDINTASVADIFVEQAQAELDVALALLNANVKDATFQEFYFVQEGELGTAVADARAEVRSDGKKHHLKAAVAAIRAFFKFLVTKVTSFFKKSATYGDAASKGMADVIKEAEQETGKEMDIKLPTTKEDFNIIYSFFNEMDEKEFDPLVEMFDKLIDTVIQGQDTVTDNTHLKSIDKMADEIVERVNKLKLASKPDPGFASEKAKRKALKKGYKDAYGEKESPFWVLDTKSNTWMIVEKADPSKYMGKEEFDKLVAAIKKSQSAWEPTKKKLLDLQKQVNSLITSAGTESDMSRPVRPKTPDGKYDKGEFKKSVEQYKKDAAAYDKSHREVNRNRLYSDISKAISKVTGAINTMASVAENITKEAMAIGARANAKARDKYNLTDEWGNKISAGEAAKRRRDALAKGEDVSFKKKDEDDLAGMPKGKSKFGDSNRKFENDSTNDSDTRNVDGITFTRAIG